MDIADLPGGASGLLVRGYKGKEADRLVTASILAWSRLSAELRGHGRRAAEKLSWWKTRADEHRVIDASPAAITLAVICTKTQMGHARVAAHQKRWDRLRASFDVILDQGADMADPHGGASGVLVRDCKGKDANRLVTRIDHGVVSLVAELRATSGRPPSSLGQWNGTAWGTQY